MFAEVCMDYGWTLNYVLEMPAKQFFAMAKAAREVREERVNMFLFELCDVVPTATGVSEYHKEIRKVYFNRVMNLKGHNPQGVYDAADPNQGLAAAMKLAKAFRGA